MNTNGVSLVAVLCCGFAQAAFAQESRPYFWDTELDESFAYATASISHNISNFEALSYSSGVVASRFENSTVSNHPTISYQTARRNDWLFQFEASKRTNPSRDERLSLGANYENGPYNIGIRATHTSGNPPGTYTDFAMSADIELDSSLTLELRSNYLVGDGLDTFATNAFQLTYEVDNELVDMDARLGFGRNLFMSHTQSGSRWIVREQFKYNTLFLSGHMLGKLGNHRAGFTYNWQDRQTRRLPDLVTLGLLNVWTVGDLQVITDFGRRWETGVDTDTTDNRTSETGYVSLRLAADIGRGWYLQSGFEYARTDGEAQSLLSDERAEQSRTEKVFTLGLSYAF